MIRLTVAALTAALISSAAIAQEDRANLPRDPSAPSSSITDDSGTNPVATPGANPHGGTMDSTKSGDDGAYARENAGTKPQGNHPSGNGASGQPAQKY